MVVISFFICIVSALPEVQISSTNVVVEFGRMISLDCTVTSVNGGDEIKWFKLNSTGMPIPG